LQTIQLTRSYSSDIQNIILGYGEQGSAKILSNYLSRYRRATYLDASSVLFVYEKNGMKHVHWEKSQAALENFLANKQFDQLIITEFIAATLEGKRTILGRNGSNFSLDRRRRDIYS
jgi:aspartokinase/homoserine dehydrogenase 1